MSSKTTRLYLVRHGATQASAEDRFAGAIDVELSAEGLSQAHSLGARLRDVPLAAVYSSPMKRTLATAHELADPQGVPVHALDAFREIAHGHWENRARRDVEREFADEYKRWEQDPYTFAPAEGETGLSVVARAFPALRDAITAHPGEHVAIVSHKATIRLMLCALLGMDARGYRDHLDLSPASLTVLDFKDEVRGRLICFNDTSHYERFPGKPEPRLSSWWDSNA
ncbi:MAG: histidine phosphatase family protein [Proteobacteria bacterium]|nr:MAG: histidine phosphatase family protein [Pseudomonadota bacterium]